MHIQEDLLAQPETADYVITIPLTCCSVMGASSILEGRRGSIAIRVSINADAAATVAALSISSSVAPTWDVQRHNACPNEHSRENSQHAAWFMWGQHVAIIRTECMHVYACSSKCRCMRTRQKRWVH